MDANLASSQWRYVTRIAGVEGIDVAQGDPVVRVPETLLIDWAGASAPSGQQDASPETAEEQATPEEDGKPIDADTMAEPGTVDLPDATLPLDEAAAGDAAEVVPLAKVHVNLPAEGTIAVGDEIRFTADLEGCGNSPWIQWQYSEDGVTWRDIPGANGISLDIVLTPANSHSHWRAAVTITDQSL